MLPIQNVTYAKRYLYEMLVYENVLYIMLLIQNLLTKNHIRAKMRKSEAMNVMRTRR